MKPIAKTISIYRTKGLTAERLLAAVTAAQFAPLSSLDTERNGFVPIEDAPARYVGGDFVLFKHRHDARILPRSVIRQAVAEKVAAIESSEGRRVGRKETREITEAVTVELLPRSFVKSSYAWAWFDTSTGLLYIGASESRSLELIERLQRGNHDAHEVSEMLDIRIFDTPAVPAHRFNIWIVEEPPKPFTRDDSAKIKSVESGQVTIKDFSTAIDKAVDLLSSGALCSEIAITWDDRISFAVTDNLVIKRIALLDILTETVDPQDNEHDQFDADFYLLAKGIANVVQDLEKALT